MLAAALMVRVGCEADRLSAALADPFEPPRVLQIRIDLAPEAMASLRTQPRNDVPATVYEAEGVYRDVRLHLKGSTGSWRTVDDKPAMTLNFGSAATGQTFYGRSKIHLNNSVEDPSYLHEAIGSELSGAAGVPAPRVTHAIVTLNRRRLGLYVVKEGVAPEFLQRHFRDGTERVLEFGDGRDITQFVRRVSESDSDYGTALRALASAVEEPNLAHRWQQLEYVLDTERFASFLAMEILTCHRDGYGPARNNARAYYDPSSRRFVFLPHGIDQLFGREDWPLHPRLSGDVARAFIETPLGASRCRERLGQMFTNLFQAPALTRRVAELSEPLQRAVGVKEARALAREAKDLQQRIARRIAWVGRQLNRAPPAAPTRE